MWQGVKAKKKHRETVFKWENIGCSAPESGEEIKDEGIAKLFQSKKHNISETEIELTAAEIAVGKVLKENSLSSNSLDCGWVSLQSREVMKINSFIKVDTEYWKLAASTDSHEEDSTAGSLIHQDRLAASAEAYEYKVWKETWKDVVQNLSTHIRLILMNSNFYHLNLSDPRDGSNLVAELAQLDRYSDF